MRSILVGSSALLLGGCVGTIVLYADPELAHDEAVSRLTKLLNDEAVLSLDAVEGAHRKLSSTRTQITSGPMTLPARPAPGHRSPAAMYDRTVVEFNTSAPGYARIWFKSYRPGRFADERSRESEADLAKRLASLKSRGSEALGRRPPLQPNQQH